jgi:hypothetical protein
MLIEERIVVVLSDLWTMDMVPGVLMYFAQTETLYDRVPADAGNRASTYAGGPGVEEIESDHWPPPGGVSGRNVVKFSLLGIQPPSVALPPSSNELLSRIPDWFAGSETGSTRKSSLHARSRAIVKKGIHILAIFNSSTRI